MKKITDIQCCVLNKMKQQKNDLIVWWDETSTPRKIKKCLVGDMVLTKKTFESLKEKNLIVWKEKIYNKEIWTLPCEQ